MNKNIGSFLIGLVVLLVVLELPACSRSTSGRTPWCSSWAKWCR